MWFFLAVLVLWGTTVLVGRQNEAVLPPLLQWGWWTLSLYLCGAAAFSSAYATLQDRVMGLFGYTLFVVYYTTMARAYMEFLPSDTDSPNLWPTVFLAVNLLGPLVLVSAGCMRAGIQRGR